MKLRGELQPKRGDMDDQCTDDCPRCLRVGLPSFQAMFDRTSHALLCMALVFLCSAVGQAPSSHPSKSVSRELLQSPYGAMQSRPGRRRGGRHAYPKLSGGRRRGGRHGTTTIVHTGRSTRRRVTKLVVHHAVTRRRRAPVATVVVHHTHATTIVETVIVLVLFCLICSVSQIPCIVEIVTGLHSHFSEPRFQGAIVYQLFFKPNEVAYSVVPADVRDYDNDSDDLETSAECEHGVPDFEYCALCEENTVIITS